MVLLAPNKWKYRKQFRGRVTGKAQRGNRVSFGEFGMKAISGGYVTNRQLEAARKVIVRITRKVGKVWMRVFPDLPYSKKALEMPMGSGKGDVSTYRVRVHPGRVLFEISGVTKEDAEKVLHQAGYKLPVQVSVIARDQVN